MASLSTTMTAAVERGMRLASVEFAIDVIRQLNSEGVLTCGVDEAMKLFDFDGVSVVSSRSKASKKRESAKASRQAGERTAGENLSIACRENTSRATAQLRGEQITKPTEQSKRKPNKG